MVFSGFVYVNNHVGQVGEVGQLRLNGGLASSHLFMLLSFFLEMGLHQIRIMCRLHQSLLLLRINF